MTTLVTTTATTEPKPHRHNWVPRHLVSEKRPTKPGHFRGLVTHYRCRTCNVGKMPSFHWDDSWDARGARR